MDGLEGRGMNFFANILKWLSEVEMIFKWRPTPCYSGEWFTRKHGTAKKDMLCDWCCPPTEIKTGDKCAAESMGVDGQGTPYYQWEEDFISIRIFRPRTCTAREAYEEWLEDHHEPCLWEDDCTPEMYRRCRYRICEDKEKAC
jgi:hypothetical protein